MHTGVHWPNAVARYRGLADAICPVGPSQWLQHCLIVAFRSRKAVAAQSACSPQLCV